MCTVETALLEYYYYLIVNVIFIQAVYIALQVLSQWQIVIVHLSIIYMQDIYTCHYKQVCVYTYMYMQKACISSTSHTLTQRNGAYNIWQVTYTHPVITSLSVITMSTTCVTLTAQHTKVYILETKHNVYIDLCIATSCMCVLYCGYYYMHVTKALYNTVCVNIPAQQQALEQSTCDINSCIHKRACTSMCKQFVYERVLQEHAENVHTCIPMYELITTV